MEALAKIEDAICELWANTDVDRERMEPKMIQLCKALQAVRDLVEAS